MNNKNILAAIGIAAFAVLSTSTVFASTFSVSTVAGGANDYQEAVTGTLTSSSFDIFSDNTAWTGPAQATATATEAGDSSVSVDALSAFDNFNLSAKTAYSTSYTNNTATSIDFTYNFFINGPSVEIFDYAYIDETSGLTALANANVSMSTTGGASDELVVSLELLGGRKNHSIFSSGDIASLTTFDNLNDYGDIIGFGYKMNDVFGAFSGSLAAGETVTIESMMYASVFGPGWELGAKASIGDPNDLNLSGFSGSFDIASVSAVPLPASAWFFATGLLGLFGISKRRKV